MREGGEESRVKKNEVSKTVRRKTDDLYVNASRAPLVITYPDLLHRILVEAPITEFGHR